PEGTYTIAWRVLSAVDGHITRGIVPFSVGVASAGVEAPIVEPTSEGETSPFVGVVRWLAVLGMVLVVGGLAFHLVLTPLALRGVRGLPPGELATFDRVLGEAVGRIVWVGASLLLLGNLGLLVGQLLLSTTDASVEEYARLAVATRPGQLGLARLGLAAALAVALAVGGRKDRSRRRWPVLALGGSFVVVLTLTSHSAASGDLLALAADMVHLAALAAWVGGLAALCLAVPPALSKVDASWRGALLGRLVGNFSTLALASVACLAITGLYQASVHVGDLNALVEDPYGLTLLIKLALVAPLLALGAINHLLFRPGLVAAAREPRRRVWEQVAALAASLRLVARAEVGIAILVILVAAVLANTPPARVPAITARGLELREAIPDGQVHLLLTPGRPGRNVLDVTLNDSAGSPGDAERVFVELTFRDAELGTSELTLEPVGPGRYRMETDALSLEGRWQLTVVVRRPGREDARAPFLIDLASDGARPAGAERATPVTGLAAGLGGGVLGLGVFLYAVRLRRRARWRRRALLATGLSLVLVGTMLGVRSLTGTSEALERNPIPPTTESVAIGRQVYQAQCAACHGAQGRGDGPAAATLNPPPVDLTQHVGLHTDGELYRWISDGVPGTAMPAFRDRLTPDERWHLINYLRTLAPASR
ncbi:MAG TPA: CopD family protein, partial [Chloroflexota bacterium]